MLTIVMMIMEHTRTHKDITRSEGSECGGNRERREEYDEEREGSGDGGRGGSRRK